LDDIMSVAYVWLFVYGRYCCVCVCSLLLGVARTNFPDTCTWNLQCVQNICMYTYICLQYVHIYIYIYIYIQERVHIYTLHASYRLIDGMLIHQCRESVHACIHVCA